MEERRREIESKELERKEAIIARNKERETRVETQRRSSRGHLDFAFGSSAPRMMEPRVDSASGYWGSRRLVPKDCTLFFSHGEMIHQTSDALLLVSV